MPHKPYRLGIDLGGTKIAGTILDPDGAEVFGELQRPRFDTEREKGYEAILDKVALMYELLRNSIGGAPHTLGIGTPGSISARTGLMRNSNTTCLNGTPFKIDLVSRLGRDAEIENDANCFAMAEAQFHPGKFVFGVIMGTGCGGGFVIGNRLHKGPQAIAGEWGHHTIDPFSGPECYCGSRGCVETYISGGGLENRFHERFGRALTAREILASARRGEREAVLAMDDFLERFGVALANVINIIDPDVVVLGGGLSNIEELYTIGVERVRRYLFSETLETSIVRNRRGDSAGVIGAALVGI